MEVKLSPTTPTASTSWLPAIDKIVKEAESLESLIEGILNAAVPATVAFDPEINTFLALIDSVLTKAAGPAPAVPPTTP